MLFRKFDKKKKNLKKNTGKILTSFGLMLNDLIFGYAESTIFLDLINRKKPYEPFWRNFFFSTKWGIMQKWQNLKIFRALVGIFLAYHFCASREAKVRKGARDWWHVLNVPNVVEGWRPQTFCILTLIFSL